MSIRKDTDPKIMSFAYHAQGLGLSAALTKPCCENIPSLATASLSMTGGESYSTVRNYNWKGLISFDEASAYATGNPGSVDKDGKATTYDTLSTVIVRNLNVANMVHAGLLVARVTSKHTAGNAESEITFSGSTIQDLVIGGSKPVTITLDEKPFADKPTYSAFAEDFLKRTEASKESSYDTAKKGVICCSLATDVGDKKGFVYPIPDFGTIYVAQVLMKPSYRRISMLRFELGCPIAGTVEVAAGESNGVEYWPT